MRRRLTLVFLSAAIAALALPWAAQADVRVLTFDDLAANAFVETQYQARGATFGGAGFPGQLTGQACSATSRLGSCP